jgi:hypothetical protein
MKRCIDKWTVTIRFSSNTWMWAARKMDYQYLGRQSFVSQESLS